MEQEKRQEEVLRMIADVSKQVQVLKEQPPQPSPSPSPAPATATLVSDSTSSVPPLVSAPLSTPSPFPSSPPPLLATGVPESAESQDLGLSGEALALRPAAPKGPVMLPSKAVGTSEQEEASVGLIGIPGFRPPAAMADLRQRRALDESIRFSKAPSRPERSDRASPSPSPSPTSVAEEASDSTEFEVEVISAEDIKVGGDWSTTSP